MARGRWQVAGSGGISRPHYVSRPFNSSVNAGRFKAGHREAPRDSEDTLNFCALTGIRPMVETYPLEQAAAAYDRMMSGKARFRVVLTMGG